MESLEAFLHRIQEESELTKEDASLCIEWVLDVLVEVGNGTSEKTLHDACDVLFNFRDKFFKLKY